MSKYKRYWLAVRLIFVCLITNILLNIFSANPVAVSYFTESISIIILTLLSILSLFRVLSYVLAGLQMLYGALQLYTATIPLVEGFGTSISQLLKSPLLLSLFVLYIALYIVAPGFVLFSSRFRQEFKEIAELKPFYISYLRAAILIGLVALGADLPRSFSNIVASFGEHD